MTGKLTCGLRIRWYLGSLAVYGARRLDGSPGCREFPETTSGNRDFANPLSFIYNLCQSSGGIRHPTEDNYVAEQTGTEMNDLVTMTADVVAAYVAQNT